MARTSLLLLIATCLLGTTTSGLAGEPMFPRISFGADAARQAAVSWNTAAPAPSLVEVRSLGEAEWRRHEGQSEPWLEQDQIIHTVEIDGLQPDTAYEYRVGDGQAWSMPYRFRTGPSDPCQPFQFVALGDDRSQDDFGPDRNWAPILSEALAGDPEFVLNGGDMVREGSDHRQWFNWLDHTADMLSSVPHLLTIGNHDDDRLEGDGAIYNKLFALPHNDVSGTEDYYFMTYGDLIVVSLSTTTFHDDGFQAQAAWLDRVLADTPRRWKVVFLHHPIYTCDLAGLMHPPNEQGQNAALVPIFDRHHVDLVLQSHNHWYERFRPSFGGVGDEAQPVESEAAGTVYVTTGGAGAYTVDINDFLGLLDLTCALTPGCVVLRGEHHYILFEVSANRLRATVRSTAAQNFGSSPDNQDVIDQFELVKQGDERADCEAPSPSDAGADLPDTGSVVDGGEVPDAPPPPDASQTPDAAPPPDGSAADMSAADSARQPPDASDGSSVHPEDGEGVSLLDGGLLGGRGKVFRDAGATPAGPIAEGCACDSAGGDRGALWLIGLALIGLRRRRPVSRAGSRREGRPRRSGPVWSAHE